MSKSTQRPCSLCGHSGLTCSRLDCPAQFGRRRRRLRACRDVASVALCGALLLFLLCGPTFRGLGTFLGALAVLAGIAAASAWRRAERRSSEW